MLLLLPDKKTNLRWMRVVRGNAEREERSRERERREREERERGERGHTHTSAVFQSHATSQSASHANHTGQKIPGTHVYCATESPESDPPPPTFA